MVYRNETRNLTNASRLDLEGFYDLWPQQSFRVVFIAGRLHNTNRCIQRVERIDGDHCCKKQGTLSVLTCQCALALARRRVNDPASQHENLRERV